MMEAEVVRRVAGRMYRLDLEARPGKLAAVPQGYIVIHRNDETAPVWALRILAGMARVARHAANERARRSRIAATAPLWSAWLVRDENVGYPLARQRLQQHIELTARCGPRIHHRDLALPDHIEVGALEGERAGIAAHDPPQAGRDLLKRAILERHLAGKWRCFLALGAQCGLFAGWSAAESFGRGGPFVKWEI